MSKKSFFK